MGIDAREYACGLRILWDPNIVHLSGFNGNQCFISAEFKVIGFSVSRVLTNVHWPHNSHEKLNFINTLINKNEWAEGRHWICYTQILSPPCDLTLNFHVFS